MGRYENIRAVVVGLGRSGVAAARLLAREGAAVTATDTRAAADLGPAIEALSPLGARFELGGHDPETLARAGLVVVSPGARTDVPLFDRARRDGVRITGEFELASEFITAPVAAITGTNGKSTTTSLIGHIASSAGRRTFCGGNLGTPLSEAVLAGTRWDLVVAEASSFQLETIEQFRPAVSLLLNLRPDHQDRYPDLDAYGRAKARIFMNQRPEEFAVVNADDEGAMRLARGIRPKVVAFSRAHAPAEGVSIARERDGAWHLTWRTGGRGEACILDNPRIPGAHNAENAAAAMAAARLLKIGSRDVCMALNSYAGLEHRIELVAARGGADWYNDSKATNVDAVTVSLASFTRPIIWIAGGRHKGSPYAPLADLVRGHVKAALLIGESAGAIADDLAGAAAFTRCGTLEAAVAEAARISAPGDVVLLSPACASYDQFADYEDRGRAFKALVLALPGGR